MTDAIIFVVLLVLGYGFGQLNERRHYKSIQKRESELQSVVAVGSRIPPADALYRQQLVVGSVVVASDYFKSFVASLVNIFGGRVRTYEPLLDRGRREALLRVKEQAKDINASMVFNIKYETSRIGGGVTTIEVLAYGSALIPVSNEELSVSQAVG
ncbi:MAG: heavy metal-binding domain-containing protein [Pseudomonadota bacterium]